MKKKYEQTKYDKQAQERIKLVIDTFFGGSQQELSDRCGIHKASVSQYVNGKNVPSNITAAKICIPLGINPAWIMGFDVPMYELQKQEGEMGKAEETSSYLWQKASAYFLPLNEDNKRKALVYLMNLHDLQMAEEAFK